MGPLYAHAHPKLERTITRKSYRFRVGREILGRAGGAGVTSAQLDCLREC